MTPDERKALQSLRQSGHVVAIFFPEDLEGVPPERFEDVQSEMIQAGHQTIDEYAE